MFVNSYYLLSLTAFTNTLAGLKAGMLCAGIVIVVRLVMLRAAFSARCLMMKLPNPRRYTGSPAMMEFLTTWVNSSITF